MQFNCQFFVNPMSASCCQPCLISPGHRAANLFQHTWALTLGLAARTALQHLNNSWLQTHHHIRWLVVQRRLESLVATGSDTVPRSVVRPERSSNSPIPATRTLSAVKRTFAASLPAFGIVRQAVKLLLVVLTP